MSLSKCAAAKENDSTELSEVSARKSIRRCLSGTMLSPYLIAMRIFILLVAGLLNLASSCLLAEDMDRRLEAFFRTYLDRHFEQQPLSATRLGDHRFDDRLDDLSPGAREQWVTLTRQTLTDLPREIEFERLSVEGRLDYRIWMRR